MERFLVGLDPHFAVFGFPRENRRRPTSAARDARRAIERQKRLSDAAGAGQHGERTQREAVGRELGGWFRLDLAEPLGSDFRAPYFGGRSASAFDGPSSASASEVSGVSGSEMSGRGGAPVRVAVRDLAQWKPAPAPARASRRE